MCLCLFPGEPKADVANSKFLPALYYWKSANMFARLFARKLCQECTHFVGKSMLYKTRAL